MRHKIKRTIFRCKDIKTTIAKFQVDSKCRTCLEKDEKIAHTVSARPKLVLKEFKRRHDNVAIRQSTGICRENAVMNGLINGMTMCRRV